MALTKPTTATVFGTATTDDYLLGTSGNDRITGGISAIVYGVDDGIDTMQGGSGDDIYIVNNTADVIIETVNNGTDTVFAGVSYTLAGELENIGAAGTAGVTLTGNSKDNILDGTTSTHSDTLKGLAGNDTYFIGTGDTVAELAGGGTDTIISDASINLSFAAYNSVIENATLSGTTAGDIAGNGLANQLTGNSADNTLTGGAGNDILDGGLGANDTLIGGSGDDTYFVRNVDVVTEALNGGTDTIISNLSVDLSGAAFANIENITLTYSSSVINATGNTLKNVIKGNSGSNTLRGWSAADTLFGFQGDDTLDGGTDADSMTGGKGDDTYLVDHASDKVVELTGEGTDTINSSLTINALAVNVEKVLLTGTALINATGNTLVNTMTGNSNNNVLKGLDGNDTLNGMAGLDTLDGGIGADAMTGGVGNDLYIVDNAGDTVTELTGGGTDTVQSSVTFSFNTAATGDDFVDNLTLTGTTAINGTGNSQDNVLTGNSAINTLTGLEGNDSYYVTTGDIVIDSLAGASGGTDTVFSAVTFSINTAAAGDDNIENITLTGTTIGINATGNDRANIITGNSSINILTGGLGNDTYVVSLGDIIIEADSEGTDTVNSAVTFTLAANVENLNLMPTASINGTGNTLDNIIVGNSSANTLTGLAGKDTITGGNGNDVIIGGTGRDVISVGNGITPSGLDGADVVRFDVGVTDTVATATSIAGVDLCKDLTLASDKIDLTGVAVSAVGTTVTGSVTESTFITNMNALLSAGSAATGAGFDVGSGVNAAIATANAGGLNGRSFLAVDLDASGTFTATDFVIEITGSSFTNVPQTAFI